MCKAYVLPLRVTIFICVGMLSQIHFAVKKTEVKVLQKSESATGSPGYLLHGQCHCQGVAASSPTLWPATPMPKAKPQPSLPPCIPLALPLCQFFLPGILLTYQPDFWSIVRTAYMILKRVHAPSERRLGITNSCPAKDQAGYASLSVAGRQISTMGGRSSRSSEHWVQG